MRRDRVRELAPGLDERGHARELRLRELVVEHRPSEHAPVLRVGEPGFERGLHDADGARRGLEPAVLEALHLEVEALAEPAGFTDEVLGRHEPVVERDLVRVHAAVADRVDRSAFHLAAAVLGERERVARRRFLVDDEQREPAVTGVAIGIRARAA